MSDMFPFRFPLPTAIYMTLYVLTLVVHVIFMNYVLVGSAYVAVVSIFTGGPERKRQKTPMALVLRDWLPFALGATITAGVAPLLFIQILYQKRFYTANLLLFHRWMAIVPVLIVGFYLLYILKSRRIGHWAPALRGAVGVGAFLCIAFTGYSWTENHLLGMQSRIWPDFYGSGRIVYFHPELIPRLAIWFFGAIPTCMAIVSWQLRQRQGRGDLLPAAESRRAAALAVCGLGLALCCVGLYYAVMDDAARAAVTRARMVPYVGLGALGLALETAGWLGQFRAGSLRTLWLSLITGGGLLAIVCATVLREELRLARVDIQALYDQHRHGLEVGGFWIFLAFLVLNAGLIAWCVRVVRSTGAADQAQVSS